MTTTDQIKFIVGRLNDPPFNKTYNLISFDSLEMFTLLQTLSDVVLSIEDKVPCDEGASVRPYIGPSASRNMEVLELYANELYANQIRNIPGTHPSLKASDYLLFLIQPMIDIREEGADETAIRLFSSLRILKYKFPTQASELSRLRAGLVQGN